MVNLRSVWVAPILSSCKGVTLNPPLLKVVKYIKGNFMGIYKQIKVNLDPSFHQQIINYAKINNITMAEVFRQCVGTKIKDSRESKVTRVHKTTDPKLLYHLNQVGNSLNQIAKSLKSSQILDDQILIQLINIENSLKSFL